MKYTYPHTINNGHGEELTFIRLVKHDGEDRLEVENKVQPGAGPPMHVHFMQDESITVLKGKLAAQIAGHTPTYHGPGETITFTRGVSHRFWNAGETILECKGWISPPNNIVYFLTEIYKSVKNNGGQRPGIFDGAYLQARYSSEFDMVEIPFIVKKTIFPIINLLGRLTRKHRRFTNAPPPVRS